jgi:hypothetical protein
LNKKSAISSLRGFRPEKFRMGGAAFWRGPALACLLAGATVARAQNVVAPPPEAYQIAPAPVFGSTPTGEGLAPVAGMIVSLGPQLILDLHPSMLYRLIYAEGLPVGPGKDVSTVIQQFSPGLHLQLGTHWTLSYSSSLSVYSSSQFADATSQNVVLSGKTTYEDWAFGFSQSYSVSDSILQETETQTEQQGFTTTFSANRQLGSHLSAQFGANQTFSSASQNGSSQDIHAWTGSAGLTDQLWSRFGVGVIASGGVDLITPGQGISFEQGQLNLNYQAGDKLRMSVSGGMEDSQFGGVNLVNPTLFASIVYRPFERTTLTLTGSRMVNPSLYQDLVTVNTSVIASVAQRLLGRLTLSGSVGFSSTPYIGFAQLTEANAFTLNGAPLQTTSSVTRQDDSTFVNIRLTCGVLKRGTASLFYQDSRTSSSVSGFSLASTQVGLELGYHY